MTSIRFREFCFERKSRRWRDRKLELKVGWCDHSRPPNKCRATGGWGLFTASALQLSLKIYRHVPALKAPEQASPGQRPGLPCRGNVWRPEWAQGVFALSARAGGLWARHSGRCPGLASSVPMTGHPDLVFKRTKLRIGISEISSSVLFRKYMEDMHYRQGLKPYCI